MSNQYRDSMQRDRDGVNRPSTATSRALWANWLVPSFTDLLFICILFLLTTGSFSSKLLGDAGIGWHIRDGQQILRDHEVPRVDSFSATMEGKQWFAWEWLYDAGIAVVADHAGWNGVVFLTVLVIAVAFAYALGRALLAGATLPLALFLLALALGASSIHFLTRPHVFSWLFSVIWFSTLDDASRASNPQRRRSLYWLPAIMLLWVNLHGGFLFGLILCLIYLVAGTFEYWASPNLPAREQAGKWLRHLSGVTGLAFLASLVNPYGVALYVHIYHYLGDHFLMDHIDEFQSPNFHGVAQKCFGLLLLITFVALAANREKMQTTHWMVILFAVYSGLYASRNLPVSSLLIALVIAPLLSSEIAAAAKNGGFLAPVRSIFRSLSGFSTRVTMMETRFRGHVWPVIAVVLGLWICLHNGALGSHQMMNAQFSESRFPTQAVRFLEEENIHEPIFAPDYWGGYLIYSLYPVSKAFVDDRHDLYGSAFFREYLTTIHVEPGWHALLDRLQARWVLVPRESPLANILKETPAWNVVYQDKTAVLYHQTN
jgi:hypothetical protein